MQMKLLIAIPALNEEESIQSIIERSLAARAHIIEHTPVTAVDVAVVSDGSTDRTVEIASRYTDRIKLIVFERNRGYGAAIKEAWEQSDADLLSFLDADGTCDPLFFTQLCNTLFEAKADVVLGSRMGPESKMPAVRRLGNMIFASMLTVLSSKSVRDSASGMRVVRRASLPKLMPLPDGLHFTPAMSARAILSDDVKIVEIPMPYHEREGESKLRIGKDGVRFLKSILNAAFLYRPSRPLGLLGVLLLLVAAGLMLMPTLFYIENRFLLEWMIYRFVVSHLLGAMGFLLLCASYLSRKIVDITLATRPSAGLQHGIISDFFASRTFWLVPIGLFVAGSVLVLPSFFELVTTAHTTEHWSRFIVMSFLFEIAIILIVTKAVDFIIGLIANQLTYLKMQRPEPATRPTPAPQPIREPELAKRD
ncbi:MAG: glycosyltransferase family 2 protein [Chloroflexota bacterium]|nr:glycosyltransferase family 2 protein [Chloroflexota bacterium]